MPNDGQRIEVGDVVRLTRGGPEMRVDSVQRNAVHCTWFEHDMRNFGYFRSSLLVRVVGGN